MELSFDNRDGQIWLNGSLVDWRQAKTHVLDHGLHYGGTIFEGIRCYQGKIFLLSEHIDRFFYSADKLGLHINFSKDELISACKEQVSINNIDWND